jgi:hypothetical protein
MEQEVIYNIEVDQNSHLTINTKEHAPNMRHIVSLMLRLDNGELFREDVQLINHTPEGDTDIVKDYEDGTKAIDCTYSCGYEPGTNVTVILKYNT